MCLLAHTRRLSPSDWWKAWCNVFLLSVIMFISKTYFPLLCQSLFGSNPNRSFIKTQIAFNMFLNSPRKNFVFDISLMGHCDMNLFNINAFYIGERIDRGGWFWKRGIYLGTIQCYIVIKTICVLFDTFRAFNVHNYLYVFIWNKNDIS